ncbi:hypothetical protein HF838_23735 [Aneurinibacillus aneurinilyticus]|jgi:hypothetical protein|uniref:YmaF family protein n=2 Tax=Aneurinibacillus aneurinilyticus TaxID=1391 RepID=A0A848D4Q6_ANEAE|nr:hypothetical protein HMPREF0083_00486 [Aneurinibacillus aneurinilyticus ATCC 12856]NMF01213.1 hypothetical protein [Aneurinibacillus aneurinilyticus]
MNIFSGGGFHLIRSNGFVQGFVPWHNHGAVAYTSISKEHVHLLLNVSEVAVPLQDGSHIHYIEGYVLFEDGHVHYYRACSSPAISVGDGTHTHYFNFDTTEDVGHKHHVSGFGMPAPGDR